MVPTLITRSQICDITWNKLIEHSGQAVVYGFTFYLDLVCESWKALIWPENGDYEIVMPIPVRRKLGIELVYQPLFCQYLGIFSKLELTIEQAAAFCRTLSAHFSYISAYHFNPENFQALQKIRYELNACSFTENATYWLNLGSGYEKIFSKYAKDRWANLKKAKNANWEILKSDRIHPLIFLFVQNHARNISGGVDPSAYNRLEGIFEIMKRLKSTDIWYAHRDGIIHAGILVIRYAGRAIFLFNAADEMGRKLNARTWLLDRYFSDCAGTENLFDFESPEVESISGFYQSFGSERTPYLVMSKNRLWLPFRQLQNLRKLGRLKPVELFTKALIRFEVHFQRSYH
ncbi:GNAT family N-acetyltransferase [Dyadobacter luticola]|uniref:GNAT family N-acetyltransferase n=1 Tax=Dyadobacter luticola TaxID=1979387 RepID=A0A5R9L1T0_9BACT|nr:GNAT family N-acetyltransferase [Dyadobacter luticola]TLV02337.1 GNAT family N-acetyltransferase [Dyadobacter luticola]